MLVLRTALAFASLILPLAAQGSDAHDKTPSDFARFVKDGDGGHFDTAITTYKKGDVTLVLFSAVHVADARCYAALNDRFSGCDVLLYELVGPADYRPTKQREERFNPLSMLQNMLKTGLELTFQLDEIDYQAPNFVHADMTPKEFEKSMEERGESLLSIMWGMMLGGMKAQAAAANEPPPDFDLVKAFRSGEGRHTMRMAFAQQLEQVELVAAGGEGSTLLEGRNEKCLEVLTREIAAGRKRIGIFYGAAHMPHMEKRLVDGFGFQKAGHEWLVAWDCAKRPDVKYDRELVKARQRARDEIAVLVAKAKAYRLQFGNDTVPSPKELAAAPLPENDKYAGPLQDPWGHDYVIQKRSTGGRWQVVSAGQDGQLGTGDDIVATEPRRGGLFQR